MDRSFRFCILLTLGVMIPALFMVVPLYLRHNTYATYHIPVSSTDSRVLAHHVSTVWCESERIVMNTTFNAFLVGASPSFENTTRTYWTTKHFDLRSEEREYWGFYLPKDSVMTLGLCARYDGAKIVVLKGKRNIKKCVKHEDDEYEDGSEMSDEDDDYLTDDDAYETGDEDSSLSSSEEDFNKECRGALFNQTLTPVTACNDTHWQVKDIVSYTVPSSDYYYVLFSSLNNIHVNKIISKITLRKPIYDVRAATDSCLNATVCEFPFSFASSEHVVLEIPDAEDWIVDAAEISCQPRTMLYFPFYLGVPISILFFAFRGSK